MQNNKVLIIGGPTGSGESTITNALVEKYPLFKRLVTATSRAKRSGETDKQNYYFFTKEEFEKNIASGNILEHTYIENRDTYYGTYKPDLEQKLQSGYVIVNVDYVGVLYYKKHYNALAIFIKPESIESLAERLKKRNPEMTEQELSMRLENAENEIRNEEEYYDYSVINADNCLNEAIQKVEAILKSHGFQLN
ncbi:MAG TPA: guanylate kinase [Patescibacteria group bacterium]